MTQGFKLLLNLLIVYYKNKVYKRSQQCQNKWQDGDHGIDEVFKACPAAGRVWIVAILLTEEVADELCLQSVGCLLWQGESDKCYHLQEYVVAEDDQKFLLGCAHREGMLSL